MVQNEHWFSENPSNEVKEEDSINKKDFLMESVCLENPRK